jgi:hypothetical protein
MRLVEVTLFTQKLPGALGLVSHNLGLCELSAHLDNLVLETLVLIVYVSYQPNVVIIEGALLLQLKPLLLEDVQGL